MAEGYRALGSHAAHAFLVPEVNLSNPSSSGWGFGEAVDMLARREPLGRAASIQRCHDWDGRFRGGIPEKRTKDSTIMISPVYASCRLVKAGHLQGLT